MNLEVKKLLQDISDSIIIIESHFQNIPSLSAYTNDLKTIDAAERRLSIIGEALWKADRMDKTLSISNKNKIISLRHIIVHDYDIVEDSAIWIICNNHLPILKKEVEVLLKS